MVQRFPRTILEFEHWFRTEEACREDLFDIRWPDEFSCPGCGHKQAWRTKRNRFRCGECEKDIRVTAGTIFDSSKLPLRVWFRAIWWATNQKGGVSALGLQRTLGLGSYKTAWAMLHKLRRAMVRPVRERLNGVVEVDETLIGGYRKRRGHTEKALVVIAVEVRDKGMGRVRIRRVSEPSRKVLQAFVSENVEVGGQILTDGAWGYDGLQDLGYRHRFVVLDHEPKDAGSRLMPNVHRVISLLKRWLLGTHQGRVNRAQLDHYLDEFTFRFNRRASPHRGQLFYRVLENAVAVRPTRISALKK